MQSITPLLSRADRDALRRFICVHEARLAREAEAIAALEESVERARSVEAHELPGDVVTLHSLVRLREADTGRAFIIAVAPPQPQSGNPVPFWRTYATAALLGARKGDEVVWRCADGLCRVRVEEVLLQPGAAAPETRSQARDVRPSAQAVPERESGRRQAARA